MEPVNRFRSRLLRTKRERSWSVCADGPMEHRASPFASISSRMLFARLAAWLGRPVLLTLSMTIGSVAMLGLVFELPIWAIATLLCLSGFAGGLATAASISLAISLAPEGMRATTVSLRLTANRVGQFIIPVAAGGATAVLGAAGVFAFIGLAMAVSAVSTRWHRISHNH